MLLSPTQRHRAAQLKIETRLYQLEQMKKYIDKNSGVKRDDNDFSFFEYLDKCQKQASRKQSADGGKKGADSILMAPDRASGPSIIKKDHETSHHSRHKSQQIDTAESKKQ